MDQKGLIMNILCDYISTKRKSMEMSSQDVAKDIGVSRSMYSKMEHGKKRISDTKLLLIISKLMLDNDKASYLQMLQTSPFNDIAGSVPDDAIFCRKADLWFCEYKDNNYANNELKQMFIKILLVQWENNK